MTAALLFVLGLTRRYGAVQARGGASFAIDAGEVLGPVGPNGAGKTTLSRILMTLELPGGGEVRVDGADVVERPDEARPWLACVPGTFGLYEDRLVWEHLDLFALLLPESAGVADLLELTSRAAAAR